MDWGCEWCHARKQWAEDFGWFFKKSRSWDSDLDEKSWFLSRARPVQLGLWDVPRMVGSDGTVSTVKIVSLSPCVENLKVKEVIKVSYLNYRESSVFCVFRDSYACGRFTYMYISRIRISDMLHYYYFYYYLTLYVISIVILLGIFMHWAL